MRRALRLAARGQGRVEPNPMVGCVIVRDGRVIAEGWHRRFGGPHAEVVALRRCTADPRGATVYVTLEPCCHQGQTPPCTRALLAAGVGRVVAAMRDPNPRVAGRGLKTLRRAGIEVQVGVLAEAARTLNAPFTKLMRRKRPWVILKWAQSLDGRIATFTGDSKWISDERMRAHAHRVRGRVDALLVGRRTVETDDPLLTCRVGRARRTATRIVLDAHLRTPPRAQLVRTARDVPTWVFCTPPAPAARARRLEAAGCVVHRVPLARGPHPPTVNPQTDAPGVDLGAVLDLLGQHRMTNVLVEGGAALLGRFFDEKLADEIHVYVAPRLIGGATAPGALGGVGARRVADSVVLPPETRMRRLGAGWLVQARLTS